MQCLFLLTNILITMKVNKFSDRHIGPRSADIEKMLKLVNADSLEQLMDHMKRTARW